MLASRESTLKKKKCGQVIETRMLRKSIVRDGLFLSANSRRDGVSPIDPGNSFPETRLLVLPIIVHASPSTLFCLCSRECLAASSLAHLRSSWVGRPGWERQ